MSDKEKLEKLLNEFGIGFIEEKENKKTYIVCEEGFNKVFGYTGFAARFIFDKNGKFYRMVIYE